MRYPVEIALLWRLNSDPTTYFTPYTPCRDPVEQNEIAIYARETRGHLNISPKMTRRKEKLGKENKGLFMNTAKDINGTRLRRSKV